jgi:hypothetical protein
MADFFQLFQLTNVLSMHFWAYLFEYTYVSTWVGKIVDFFFYIFENLINWEILPILKKKSRQPKTSFKFWNVHHLTRSMTKDSK